MGSKRGEWTLFFLCLAAAGYGLALIYSATRYDPELHSMVAKQGVALAGGVPGAADAGCAAPFGKAVVAAAPAERRAAAAPGPLRQRRRHRQQELAGPAGGAVQPPTWGGGEGDLPAPAGPAAAETGGEGAQPAQVGGSAAAPCAGAVRPGVRGVRGHWNGSGVPGHLSGNAVVGGGAPPVAAGAGGSRRGGGGPPLVPAAGLRPPAVFGGL